MTTIINGSSPSITFSDSTTQTTAFTTTPIITTINTGSTTSLLLQTNGVTGLSINSSQTTTINSAASTPPLIAQINSSEVARIDGSGNLYKGGTTGPYGTAGAQINVNYIGANQMGLFLLDGEASGTSRNAVRFERTSGNTVGSITTTNSATAYNTSSDYRLKVNPTPMVGALDKVLALKPVTYKWKIDDADGEGFIAHELQEVVPSAVTGKKDDVNEDGSINPQAVDYSKLVATLTAAIQELKAEFDAYKASHP
jgi:hypothetical protein